MEKFLSWEKLADTLIIHGLKVLTGIILFVIGYWLIQRIKKIAKKSVNKINVDKTLSNFFLNVLYFGLLALVAVISLSAMGVETTSIVTIIGAAGLAIGLSLKDSLSNFAAGIVILVQRYFQVGDYIESGNDKGVVEEISIFSTRLHTYDNKVVIIPNSVLVNGSMINHTYKPERRVDTVFSIAYSDNIDRAREIILEVVKNNEMILTEPSPVIEVLQLADSSVNLAVRTWCQTANYWKVYYYMIENVKKAFDKEGITIPFPQREVRYLKQDA
ncbi:MAG: mechanosensitive ion channel [Ignavibacteriaceae bacterium]|nr:mechanosensitive ion channel [Ignavibacteriaceae bacterium]